jgi:S-adenosylmethionine:diacylglycerol 3-amino-3-carboxypropyl transferase
MHHIIIRGIERKVIFKDSQDYSNFLNRLRNVFTETKTTYFAWTLMARRLNGKSKGKNGG